MSCNCGCRSSSHPAVLPIVFLALTVGVLWAQQPPPPNAAEALFQSGLSSLSQGKFQESEGAFRQVAELEPANPRGILGLAEAYARQNKNEEALRLLQSELRKYLAYPELHFGIGNLALRTARYDLAIAEYQQVLDSIDRKSKTAAETYVRLAEAYRLKNDPDFAISLLRQAQKSQPENSRISGALAMMLDAVGRRQEAIAEYQQTLKTEPNNGLTLNNVAFLLAESDPQLALAYAHRARQVNPDDPTVADTLGWVYVKLNRPEDAIAIFREVVRKAPGRAIFRYHLAFALEQSGNHDSARKESEMALKSGPSKDEEQQINELLRKIK